MELERSVSRPEEVQVIMIGRWVPTQAQRFHQPDEDSRKLDSVACTALGGIHFPQLGTNIPEHHPAELHTLNIAHGLPEGTVQH